MRDPYTEVRRRVASGESLDLSQALVPAGHKELSHACEIVTGSRRTPDEPRERPPQSAANRA